MNIIQLGTDLEEIISCNKKYNIMFLDHEGLPYGSQVYPAIYIGYNDYARSSLDKFNNPMVMSFYIVDIAPQPEVYTQISDSLYNPSGDPTKFSQIDALNYWRSQIHKGQLEMMGFMEEVIRIVTDKRGDLIGSKNRYGYYVVKDRTFFIDNSSFDSLNSSHFSKVWVLERNLYGIGSTYVFDMSSPRLSCYPDCTHYFDYKDIKDKLDCEKLCDLSVNIPNCFPAPPEGKIAINRINFPGIYTQIRPLIIDFKETCSEESKQELLDIINYGTDIVEFGGRLYLCP